PRPQHPARPHLPRAPRGERGDGRRGDLRPARGVRAAPGLSTTASIMTGGTDAMPRRDLRALPKAHLHLHFTGSMRHETLLELAARDGITLPDALVED